jgi:hypothetical protein
MSSVEKSSVPSQCPLSLRWLMISYFTTADSEKTEAAQSLSELRSLPVFL